MYPSSMPLVPDDQYHERDFAPRDLDAERDLQRMRRPQHQTAMKKPSLANRMVRSVSRFFAAILIGVALTLAGQSYSEHLNEIIAGWAPSLASLLPAQSSKQTAERRLIGSSAAGQVDRGRSRDCAAKHGEARCQSGPVRRQARANESEHCDAAAGRARSQTADSCAAGAQGGASSGARGAQPAATLAAVSGCA